jgi:hypothetical protein
MQAIVGGSTVYPNLTEIADLFRALINDTANNTGGAGTGSGSTAGLIMPNSNPDLVTIMRSAIRTLYSDLRNIGDPQLLLDNYILTGLPPVNSNLGVGVQNPAAQVSLAYSGYFDGVQWYPQWTLPVGMRRLLGLWERQTGAAGNFLAMVPATAGLQGVLQGETNRYFEMREGSIWMPGTTTPVDLRIRCRIGYPSNYNTASLNFDTTYVPILNCGDAIAAKMLVRYAIRFSPEMVAVARDEENIQMAKLENEAIRAMQSNENERAAYGEDAVQDFAVAFSYL